MRAIISLLLLALVAGCGNDAREQATRQKFIETLSARVNMPEEKLVRSMGRAPDSAYQLNASTRLLRWKEEIAYTVPGRSSEFVAVGLAIVEVGGQPPQRRVAHCSIEWTVIDGLAYNFQYFGDGCP